MRVENAFSKPANCMRLIAAVILSSLTQGCCESPLLALRNLRQGDRIHEVSFGDAEFQIDRQYSASVQ